MGLKESGLRASLRSVSTGVVAIPDSVLLPESDDLTHFDGDIGDFDINSDQPKFNTEFTDLSLKATGSTENVFIGSTSGLERYPDVGDTHRLAIYLDNADSSLADTFFGHSLETSRDDGYAVRVREPDDEDEFRIMRFDGGSTIGLVNETNVGLTAQEWHEIEIFHDSDGDITATLFNNDGVQMTQLTANDSTYISNGSYDHTGVGFFEGRGQNDAIDFWRFV